MNGEDAGSGAIMGGLFFTVIMLGFAAVMVASMWKLFTKAGEPGWASIVPIYNLITLLKITGKPVWWIVLFCVPLVNFYALIMVCMGLAKSFGKSSGFGLGLVLVSPVFIPLPGFGNAQYVGTGTLAAPTEHQRPIAA